MSVCGVRFRKGLVEGLNDLSGGLGAHVEESDTGFGEFGIGLPEEAAHHPRVTGDDVESALKRTLAEFVETGVAVGSELTQVGNGLEAFAAGGELLKDVIFHAVRDDLSVGAAAVEDLSVVRHGKRAALMMERERRNRKDGFAYSTLS